MWLTGTMVRGPYILILYASTIIECIIHPGPYICQLFTINFKFFGNYIHNIIFFKSGTALGVSALSSITFFCGHTFTYNFLKQVVCYTVGFNSFVSFTFFKSFRPWGIVYGSLISSSAPLVR